MFGDRPLRLLYLCDKSLWDRKVPRTRFHCVQAMEEFADVRCTGNGFPGWYEQAGVMDNLRRLYYRRRNSNEPIQKTWWPDLILVYEAKRYSGWDDPLLPPTCVCMNDMWLVEKRLPEIVEPRAGLVVCHHKNEIDVWQKRLPRVRFESIPYGINPAVFKDWEQPKSIDVLLTGQTSPEFYPLRHRFAEMIRRGAFAPWKAEIRKHPDYRVNDPEAEAREYARHLNRAKIVLADTSVYLYASEKHHEIPACNSVICTNLPGERQEDFSEFSIVVGMEESDEAIIRRVRDYLKRPDELDRLARLGHDYVHSQFTTRHYAQRFVQIAEDYIRS